MRRRLTAVSGEVRQVAMADGLPIGFEPPARSVAFVRDLLALVILQGQFGDRNLVVLGPDGDELARLGTTCGTGVIDQVLDVDGEIRAIEVTPRGDFQARIDLDSLEMERVAEWR
jgi:hypothetical protein